MKVRVKRAFQNYRVGDVLQPPALLRDDLLRRGFVEPVKETREAAVASPIESAMQPPAKRAYRKREQL
jgi:hypothetical protein